MSDSVRPLGRQPTRLPRPWDSPGKNTGVRCHFLLQCMKVKLLSHVRLLVTPWTTAYQAPPSMGFSRQEHWSGVPLPSLMLYAAAAAKSLQSCPTLCDPIDGSPPGSPSLGFSRQEHWSGLPFPSPMHESEVAQSCPTLSDPMDCSLPGSSVHGIFQARVLEWGAIAFSVGNSSRAKI